MTKVTVIIPNYNHADYIIQRLESIRTQTYTDWEAIIIDDASTDNSVEIITDYLNSNTFKLKQFIKQKDNLGSGYLSWEKGILLADSEYIWIAETDDYSDAFFLEESIKVLDQNKNCAFVFCNSNYVDINGKFLYSSSKRMSELNVNKDRYEYFNANVLLNNMPLNTFVVNGSSVLFRKPKHKLPKELFGYKQSSDIFLWSYLVQNKEFAFLNKSLNFFRQHDKSTTALSNKHINLKVYEEYCCYVNYYSLNNSKKVNIIKHYAKHILIPNRKLIGYYNLNALKQINTISKTLKLLIVSKVYLSHILKNNKFWN